MFLGDVPWSSGAYPRGPLGTSPTTKARPRRGGRKGAESHPPPECEHLAGLERGRFREVVKVRESAPLGTRNKDSANGRVVKSTYLPDIGNRSRIDIDDVGRLNLRRRVHETLPSGR